MSIFIALHCRVRKGPYTVKSRYSSPLYTATLAMRIRKPRNRNSPCNCTVSPAVKRHPQYKCTVKRKIKSDTAPCHFVSTENRQPRGIFSCKNTAYQLLRQQIKPAQVKNHLQRRGEGVGLFTWGQLCKWRYSKSRVPVNESATVYR
jgi:hypothetical protein